MLTPLSCFLFILLGMLKIPWVMNLCSLATDMQSESEPRLAGLPTGKKVNLDPGLASSCFPLGMEGGMGTKVRLVTKNESRGSGSSDTERRCYCNLKTVPGKGCWCVSPSYLTASSETVQRVFACSHMSFTASAIVIPGEILVPHKGHGSHFHIDRRFEV